MKAFSALVVAAVLVFGPGKWESATPGRFEVWLAGTAGISEMHVVLHDATGLVTDLRPGGARHPGASSNPAGDRNSLVVSALSGTCDDYMVLTLRTDGAGYQLVADAISTAFHGGGGCELMIGIGRFVTMRLAAPIDASTVVLTQR